MALSFVRQQLCKIKDASVKKIVGLVACLFVGSANAGLIEHISNGGFETGSFSGWSAVNTGTGDWSINDGTSDIGGYGFGSSPSISGVYDAVTTKGDGAAGLHKLYQDILLPGTLGVAVLSWDDKVASDAVSDPGREWRVLIEDLTGSLISEVFSTSPGIGNTSSSQSFDVTSFLSAFANQSIRISFEHQDSNGNLSVGLDNVSFTTSTADVPEPISLALFGLGLAGIGFSRRKKSA